MKDRLNSILLNPFVISIAISFAIIVLLPDYFMKYKIEIVEKGLMRKGYNFFSFCDLNNDGVNEMIIFKENILGNAALVIYKKHEVIQDQWNLQGRFPLKIFKPGYSDLNNNGFKEIYFITQRKDSVFLNIVEPFQNNNQIEKFICTVRRKNSSVDFSPSEIHFEDMNLDGHKEVVFSINAGFSILPRKIYIVDLSKDTIYSSKHIGNKSAISRIDDINGDKFPEILLTTISAGNFSDTAISNYDDYSSWLIILNNKLEFFFDPIEFPSSFSSLQIIPLKANSNCKNIAVLLNTRKNSEIPDRLMIINHLGEIKSKVDLEAGSYQLYTNNIETNQIILFNYETGSLKILSNDLNINSTHDCLPNSNLLIEDLNFDGNIEFIFTSYISSSVAIYNSAFEKPIIFELTNSTKELIHYNLVKNNMESTGIFIQNNKKWCVINYNYDSHYWLKAPFYIGIFFFVLFLEYLIIKGQKNRDKKKKAIENQISELQIKTIKNQVDPHFVFNAINTISEMMLTDDKIEADKFICNFSDLMRKMLQNSDRISHSIKDELDYIENFIILQKIRYNNCFKYEIQIAKEINLQTEIPKHVLYTYVENAIKHGLSVKKNNGLLKIDVDIQNNYLTLSIEDNGNGIEKSDNLKPASTGNGLLIMEKIYSLYSKIHKKKITHEIIELFNYKNKPIGIKVEIKISI